MCIMYSREQLLLLHNPMLSIVNKGSKRQGDPGYDSRRPAGP